MLGKGWEGADQDEGVYGSKDVSGDDETALESKTGVLEGNLSNQLNIGDDSLSGVVPRAICDLFHALERKEDAHQSFNHSIHCTFMQIYNEKIYDLLQDKKRQNPLVIKESARGSSSAVHVPGISEYKVFCKDDVMLLIQRGLQNRAIRCTEFNAASSSSRTI